MNGFLAELGKKLAERWVALLVLPGLLFTATATVAALLGHRNWADPGLLGQRLGALVPPDTGASGGLARTVLVLVVVLVAAFASGLCAQALATPVEQALAGRWPGLLRRPAAVLARRRRAAWRRVDDQCERAREDGDLERYAALAERRNRLALIEPTSATWIGDRLDAPAVRVHREYGVDLRFAWSRLWLLLPDSTRIPLATARRRLDDAATLGGWGLLYLALGAVWWPSAVAGVVVGLVAWRRCRSAADVYADLVEAAVDVHIEDLIGRFADEKGLRPARPQWGSQITERFRKGI